MTADHSADLRAKLRAANDRIRYATALIDVLLTKRLGGTEARDGLLDVRNELNPRRQL